jgi:RHS repeat-associated protein
MLSPPKEKMLSSPSGERVFSSAAVRVPGKNVIRGKNSHQGIFSNNHTIAVGPTWVKSQKMHQDNWPVWWEVAVEAGEAFKYDPFGRRVYKSSPNFAGIFAYDGYNLIETMTSSGAVVACYTQSRRIDEPLAEFRSGGSSYYEADGLGSITSLSSSTGVVANTYIYDSFGNLVASTGTLKNPFLYTGREFDLETGIYEYRERYYDQNGGRFLSEDPSQWTGDVEHQGAIDDSRNAYVYVLNNVPNFTDPSGLYTLKPGIPHPAGALDALLTCTENCLGSSIMVTSTSEPIPQHPPNSPHGRGVAADIHYPSNPHKLLCCASQCGAGFALDENLHPSAHATGPHIHVQIPSGRNGGRGDLPLAKPGGCSKCQ